MAEDTVRRAMVELATKLDTMAQELRKKPEERLVGVEPAVALEKAHLAAQAVSQQARAAFFLDVLACKVEDATACLADLETKCVIYHSWAKPLLACISPAARKVAAPPNRNRNRNPSPNLKHSGVATKVDEGGGAVRASRAAPGKRQGDE